MGTQRQHPAEENLQIDTQNELIRRLIELLGQFQAVDDYERELEQRQEEYAAAIGMKEGR